MLFIDMASWEGQMFVFLKQQCIAHSRGVLPCSVVSGKKWINIPKTLGILLCRILQPIQLIHIFPVNISTLTVINKMHFCQSDSVTV